MRELVRRGAHVHPGAVAVEEENGRILSLTNMSQAERDSVAISLCSPSEAAIGSIKNRNGGGKMKTLFKPKIVHRHLQDGDVLLMNRQPTLHKPSIMGFEARVSIKPNNSELVTIFLTRKISSMLNSVPIYYFPTFTWLAVYFRNNFQNILRLIWVKHCSVKISNIQ